MPKKYTPEEALAFIRTEAGSHAKVAEWAGVSRQGASNWRKVPAERVLAMEAHSKLTRYQIRADIYGEGP